jgi:hypothetical protein
LTVPFYRYTIHISKFRELQKAFLLSGTPNAEIPTDHILMATTYKMAKDYDIKYIVSGGNHATEGIMPKAWGYNARDLRFIKSVYRTFTGRSLQSLPTISLVQYLYLRFFRKISVVNLLDYYEYNRNDAKKLLAEKYGWKDYGEKHEESIFTKWFQDTLLPWKFKIDKRRAHFSSLINSGQMTREEAIKKIDQKSEIDSLFHIKNHLISDEWFLNPMEIKSHHDYPNSEFWWDLLSRIYAKIKRI